MNNKEKLMAQGIIQKLVGVDSAESLREYQQHSDDEEMQLRRALVAVSLTGIAAMGIVTLFQTGVVKRLPDPPVGNFHTEKVNSSHEAYRRGTPDAPLAVTAHAINIVLATLGAEDRPRRAPWIPILASLVAAPQAATAAQYLFYQMPKVDKAWCPYCIVDALTLFATFGLTLKESSRSVRALLARRQSASDDDRARTDFDAVSRGFQSRVQPLVDRYAAH
jgi:uncharacterized membrane protein